MAFQSHRDVIALGRVFSFSDSCLHTAIADGIAVDPQNGNNAGSHGTVITRLDASQTWLFTSAVEAQNSRMTL